jgi:hypothetical protein
MREGVSKTTERSGPGGPLRRSEGLNSDDQPRRFELVLLILFLLTLPLMNPWVRGDGVGYYAYARAPLINHNLDFTYDYQSANQSFREARCDPNGQPKKEFRTVTGHLDNHFTVGPAMLWSPFLLVAHGGVLAARAVGSHVAADGYSAPYRFAMALGSGLYGFLSLLISYRLARKYAGPLWSFLATLAIWGASSLPVYMYFNPSWSHAHSACTCALFLWYWDRTREQRSLAQWLVTGLIVGLMLDVYYANFMLVSILTVEAVPQYAKLLRAKPVSMPSILQLAGRHTLFSLVVLAVMIPTFASRWAIYGGPFSTGYLPVREFLWHSPVFFSILFSANHGLLSWTPLLVFPIIGLLLFAIRVPKVGVPFLTGVAAFYLFMSIYPDWAGISSYGNRFFVSLTALFVLGLGFLLERIAAGYRRRHTVLALASSILFCFVVWNLGLMYQWGTHLIPARGPISFREAAANQFTVVPHQISAELRSYIFRRSDLMRQIEQHDMEQMKKHEEQ